MNAEHEGLASVAARLHARHLARGGSSALPPLILMTDPARLPDPLAAASRLPAGSGVILRAYAGPERAHLAEALAALARRNRLVLLIANDAALALAVGAAGVHLAEANLDQAARVRQRSGWLVTGAAHSLPALVRAARAGLDAALLSPVFATASHPTRTPLGLHGFAALARRATLPVYALGGVEAQNAPSLLATNAIGIAAIGALSA